MTKVIHKLVLDYIKEHGEKELINKLKDTSNSNNILTIITNQGVHPLGELHKRGDVFYASKGDLDFSSEIKANKAMEKILINIVEKLKSKSWGSVYLVPFGPAVLSMQIKSLVYRVLHIDTIDVLHIGNGVHVDININPREIALLK